MSRRCGGGLEASFRIRLARPKTREVQSSIASLAPSRHRKFAAYSIGRVISKTLFRFTKTFFRFTKTCFLVMSRAIAVALQFSKTSFRFRKHLGFSSALARSQEGSS